MQMQLPWMSVGWLDFLKSLFYIQDQVWMSLSILNTLTLFSGGNRNSHITLFEVNTE